MDLMETIFGIKKAASVTGMLLLGNAMFSGSGYAQSKSPNFIFILTDDQGWSHTSNGVDARNPDSKSDYFETPSIDRLIQEGISFTQGYAPASICSPTRRGIQYGMTPARLGDESFRNNYNPDTNENIVSIPWLLKSVNPDYKTAHYGKWDLRAEIFPEDLGYDESDGNTGNRHGNHFIDGRDDKWEDVFVTNDPKRVFTLAERGANFMKRQVRDNNPFYLQISHYAPHVDIQTRQETFDKYRHKPRGEKHIDAGWAGMLEDMDTSIGVILDKVESLGISDNTYIIFMSDNGAAEFIPPVPGHYKRLHPDNFERKMRNYSLRAGKWTLYEGGIRVPFVVKGPGISEGVMSHEPVVGWDILPTISELANYENPLPDNLDGGSFAGIIKSGGEGKIDRLNDYLVFHRYSDNYGHSAIIQGEYKLIKFWFDGQMELYNLEKDLGERNDLADEYPDKTNELYQILTDYLESVNPELLKELYASHPEN